ncbi:MAG: DUF5686 and carboxypeptidase regulatory-like domain-containing protein [Bacteroidia bacterium]|nr:DUF5686 and carboxypeptidase regulatory-like domain-containing protein [Bacteroidia bacterium]
MPRIQPVLFYLFLVGTLICLGLISSEMVHAQSIQLEGRVFSIEKGKPGLPYVAISVPGTNNGTLSDSAGNFSIRLSKSADSLSFSCIGFKRLTVSVKNTSRMEVGLEPEVFQLKEIAVKPGENPAFEILRKVIENKERNNPQNIAYYSLDRYEKTRFDLNHFTDKLKKNALLKPFDFIWNYSDTTGDSITFLPVLFSETASKVYHRSNPKSTKIYIQATQTKGLKGPKIMKFAQDMNLETDIYSNFVSILEKPFPSPINDNFKLYYKYVLAGDTIYTKDDYPCRKIYFKPQNPGDVAFTGSMYIDTLSWAVVQVDLQFSIQANVNFVRNYYVQQHYSKPDSLHWMLTKSELLGDFTVVENSSELTGFFGRKLLVNRNIQLNQAMDDHFYRNASIPIELDSAKETTEEKWASLRPYGLSNYDKGVVQMTDSLASDKKFKRLAKTTLTVTNSWFPTDYLELGNIWTFYSYNLYEKSRLKFGLRSGKKVDKHVDFDGYAAYGFGDKQWKYGGHFNWNFGIKNDFHRKHTLGIYYRHDLNQNGRTENMIPLDHILTTLIRTDKLKFRTFNTDMHLFYERQWLAGIATRITAFHKRIQNYGSYRFSTGMDSGHFAIVEEIRDAGLQFSFRINYGKANTDARFGDGYGGRNISKWPCLSGEFTWSKAGIWGSGFEYKKMRARVENRTKLNRLGYLDWMLEGGKIWGNAAWPLLFTPAANQMVLGDKLAFNLMNYLEFVSDRYITFQGEYHLDGLILNYIPLVKKLKWREFVFGKAYYGGLDKGNGNNLDFPLLYASQAIGRPYYEVGFGLENIFKIARIDFVWRLDYRGNPGTYGFIVKPSFYFRF